MYESDTSLKSLLDLDDMVLLKITNHLNVSDMINFGKTCRRFAYLTQHQFEKHYSNVRWRKNRHAIKLSDSRTIFKIIGKYIRTINLAIWSDLEFYEILVTIGMECRHLTSLTLDSIRMDSSYQINDPAVSLMFSKLKQFTLNQCSWTGWCPLKVFFGNNQILERLSIIDCSAYNGNSHKLQLKEFHALKELQLVECRNLLTSVEIQRCFENNDIYRLSLINVDKNVNLFEPHLIDLLSNSIESLTLDYHRNFDFNQLIRLTKLKKFRIISNELRNVDELVTKLNTEIEELDVENVFVTKSIMEHLKSFKKLRHLSFEKCFNSISGDFFRILPEISPNLQQFVYTYNVITDCDFVHMIKLMHKLRYLSLLGCNMLGHGAYVEIVDILLKDSQRPKLKFIPPQLESLKRLQILDDFRKVIC